MVLVDDLLIRVLQEVHDTIVMVDVDHRRAGDVTVQMDEQIFGVLLLIRRVLWDVQHKVHEMFHLLYHILGNHMMGYLDEFEHQHTELPFGVTLECKYMQQEEVVEIHGASSTLLPLVIMVPGVTCGIKISSQKKKHRVFLVFCATLQNTIESFYENRKYPLRKS